MSTVKEPYAPVGIGACAVDEMKPLEVGEFCAAYYDETWILVEVGSARRRGTRNSGATRPPEREIRPEGRGLQGEERAEGGGPEQGAADEEPAPGGGAEEAQGRG